MEHYLPEENSQVNNDMIIFFKLVNYGVIIFQYFLLPKAKMVLNHRALLNVIFTLLSSIITL